MKRIILSLVIVMSFLSCKEKQETSKSDVKEQQTEETVALQNEQLYPPALTKIFNAHGGLNQWQKMNNLCYEMEGRYGKEVQTIALKDRRVKIETKDWSIGYNGKDVWLLQNEKDAYQGNARFYHNLYFYFYAMPFVLGDEGITYETVPATTLAGRTYQGVKVSYNDGVGDSPKDEYILYYDPETHLMSWLGYTVTFNKNEKSDRWSYIQYGDWSQVNELLLPKVLTWFEVEDGKPTKAKKDVTFHKITITETQLEDAVFEKPDGATIVPL